MREISPRINSPKNDDPSLCEPLHAEPTKTTTDALELLHATAGKKCLTQACQHSYRHRLHHSSLRPDLAEPRLAQMGFDLSAFLDGILVLCSGVTRHIRCKIPPGLSKVRSLRNTAAGSLQN